jgi:predicted aspartyl protease
MKVQGLHCQVLTDTGASCNLISAALVERLGLPVEAPQHRAVLQMANGLEVDHLGHVTISVTVQGYRFAAVTCTVMHLHSCEWDVLLGQQWLIKARARLARARLVYKPGLDIGVSSDSNF